MVNADAVSVYCVLALYIPLYIIKLASMVYVHGFWHGAPRGLNTALSTGRLHATCHKYSESNMPGKCKKFPVMAANLARKVTK